MELMAYNWGNCAHNQTDRLPGSGSWRRFEDVVAGKCEGNARLKFAKYFFRYCSADLDWNQKIGKWKLLGFAS